MGLSARVGAGGAKIGYNKGGGKAEIGTSGAKIGYKKRGVGASISISSNGIRVGGGIGIIDVDFNFRDGTGRVGWGFGLYEMRVSREGCNYVKDFYIGGVYTHTEYQRDEKCDKELPDRDDDGKLEDDNDTIDNKISKDKEEEAFNLDENRFPPHKIIYAELKWRYMRWHIDRFGTGEITQLIFKTSQGATGRFYQKEIWSNIFKQSGPFKAQPIDWNFISSTIFSKKEYDDTTTTFQSEVDSDTSSSVWPSREINALFGDIGAGDGNASLASFYFGTYSTFIRLCKEKTRINDFGITTFPGTDLVFYDNEYDEKLLLNANFYDENGLIPPRKLTPPPPPPPPPMDCCDKLERRIKRIEKTINTDLFIDENGVKIPRNLFIPGGRGDAEIKNYADYLATIIRIQAQSGIFPFSIEKRDVNLVQAGNQSQTYYLPTATEAVKAILENSVDNQTKNDAILNLSVRIGIMVSKVIGKITFIEKTVQAISDFLGYPRREKIVRERIEVDPTLGARKQVGFRGFGPAPRNTNRKIEKQIELIRKKLEEGDKSLESALEDFLQPDDVAVRYEDFDDESGAPDLMELIDKGR